MEINHNQDQDNQKVTIEDLLKLKRLEKPSDAFWNRFDRELQEKTWSALVAKVSIWERFQHVGRKVLMPVAAACLFVLGFFFYEEIGGSLSKQPAVEEGSIIIANSEIESLLEEQDSIKIGNVDRLLGAKNYVKEVLSIKEEVPEGRRVFTYRSLYPRSKVGGVQFVAANANDLGRTSKNNLVF